MNFQMLLQVWILHIVYSILWGYGPWEKALPLPHLPPFERIYSLSLSDPLSGPFSLRNGNLEISDALG